MNDGDAVNLGLAILRIAAGAMILAHGANHVRAVRAGPGIAGWFESIGLKPGWFHAWMVTASELLVGTVLVLGFLTPFGYGGLAAVMLVALVTVHVPNGFFITKNGWEYVGIVAAVSIGASALGPGAWSLDDALDLSFPFEPATAILIAALLGVVGSASYLAAFWRRPVQV